MNKDKLYVMRDELNTSGLMSLIEHLNTLSDTKSMTMIEIGAYRGESTKIFSKHFKSVITIDPFINDYDKNDITCTYMDLTNVYYKFLENISDCDNITLIRKTSDDAIEELKNTMVDFVYIDGLHTYDQVKKDILNYSKLINKTGYIGGHDYHPNWDGVVKAINKYIRVPDKTFIDSSWICKI
jgi:predicted O-methyltransferase YrrM